MKNSEQPAFSNPGQNNSDRFNYEKGLTKREYFAAMAMQGIMNYVKLDVDEIGSRYIGMDMVAQMAVASADALLKELEKQ